MFHLFKKSSQIEFEIRLIKQYQSCQVCSILSYYAIHTDIANYFKSIKKLNPKSRFIMNVDLEKYTKK